VTGLVVVDTQTHWSTFGEVVILGLIQVGGFGVMTVGSLLVLLVGRRLRARAGMLTETEVHHDGGGLDTRSVVLGVARISILVEAVVAVLLAVRFALGYGEPLPRALYLGVFHAVSAFNNAGFALWNTSLERFATDVWICGPIAGAIVLGGLGFPVVMELRRNLRNPWAWTLHTRLTVSTTVVLLVGGSAVFTAVEWDNPGTLGRLPEDARFLAGAFHAVNTRTAGFNSVPTGELRTESLLASDVLMFIGGGSAGTAGGIKVTTFALLAYVIWAELRGDRRVAAWGRGVPAASQRQAVTVALLGVAVVMGATWCLLAMSHLSLDVLLFEATSAFGTVGLSTGATAELPAAGQVLLAVLMFIGRLGPLTLGAALTLRSRPRQFEFPEERPIVG
jgi:trk system potassium uptake protein TrkH